ncbi:hypothetical protein JCM6882_004106 [Rhodosporidiobolus microsporus]
MRPHGLVTVLAALLLAAVAQASQAETALNVSVRSSTSSSIATRFIETVHSQRPSGFFDFLHLLTEYRLRTKTEFKHSALKPKAPGLDGKSRPSKYANHNPIFTRYAQPNESFAALEATLHRSMIFKPRGDMILFRLALAGDVAEETLEQMETVWQEREAELVASGAHKPCENWIDVGGQQVCKFDQFWKAVGPEQVIKRSVIKVAGSSPKTYPFDRFFPAERDESLPLVVFYAAPTDEAFPELFEALYALAKPKAGKPRLQFALRWKPDTKTPVEHYLPDFVAEAALTSGVEVPEIKDVSDFSARVVGYALKEKKATPKDKLRLLTDAATSLPLLASEIAATSPVTVEDVALPEQLYLNGRSIDPVTLSHAKLLLLFDEERKLLREIGTANVAVHEEYAKDIVVAANITFEQPRKSAVSLAVPTVDKPLKFVNLADAYHNLTGQFIRGSFVEGVAESEGDIDPPPVASFLLVSDLDSEAGLQLVKNALKFLDNSGEVRLSLVHNPASDASTPDRFAFSTLVAKLIASRDFAEVYPTELLAFLDLNASADSPPKRSLSDEWTQENPMSPFVNNGATAEDEETAAKYWINAARFAKRVGAAPGESAVILNGRLIDLPSHEFATGSFHALHQYELKRRIRPVVAAMQPTMPKQVKLDRRLQGDVAAIATSVIAAEGTQRQYLDAAQLKGLPTIAVGDPSRSMFSFTAVLDPLSPFARATLPILHSLASFTLTHVRVYLVPSTVPTVDLTSVRRRSFPTSITFDEDGQEIKPFVQLARGIPVGSVFDVKATRSTTGEELAGPGGKGSETIKIEKEGEVVEVVFGEVKGVAAKEKKAEAHVRDEL